MKLKKIYCYMLVTLLVINSPLVVYADSAPGTITVEGGTIGSGGIEGNSGVLKGTALAVIMATLASAGITVKVAAEDYAKGNTAINYLEDKFEEWDAKTDEAWNAYDKYRALNNTKVGEDGSLYIPEQASAIMQKFLNWLSANDAINMQQTEPSVGPGGAYVGASWTSQNNNIYSFTDGQPGYIVACKFKASSGGWCIVGFRETPFNFHCKIGNKGSTISGDKFAGKYYYAWYNNSYFTVTDITGLLDLTAIYGITISGLAGWLEWAGSTTPDTNISNTGFYSENEDIPSLVDETGNGKILKVNPGLIGQVQDGYVGSNNASIGIQDYLDALRDLYNQKALPQDITDLPDIAINGVDALTGTKEQVGVIDRDIALDQDITLPADETSITWPEVPSDSTSISDDSPADPDTSIPAMSIDLTQYFPFCLPFDIYHILQKFSADPVTPEITVNWGNILGQYGIDYTMHLDLHDYDNLAELLRNMETAAFVVGLAVVTRQMFLRG